MRPLAPELLGEVFSRCIDTQIDVADPRGGISPRNAPLLLLRVCPWWRRVALGTPHLWTVLALQHTEHVDPLAAIPLWLRHSASLPLRVYFNPDNWSLPADAPPDRLRHALAAARLLLPHFPRYTTFHAAGSQRLFQSLLPPDTHTHAPLLADLRLTLEQHFQPPEIRGTLDAPRLRRLDAWDIRPALHLTHHRLRALHLNLSGQTSLAALAPFLHACPALEACTLVRPCRDDAPLPLRHIPLPRLARLDLTWEQRAHTHVAQFLDALNAPALQALALTEVPRLGDRAFAPPLHALLAPLPARLQHLHLLGLHLHPDAILPLLDALPALESLHVLGIALDTYFFDALTNDPALVPLPRCPKLACLDLQSSQVQLGLVRMIESRAPPTDDPPALTRISLAHCTGISRTGLDVLARLAHANPAVRIDGLDDIRRTLDDEDIASEIGAWRHILQRAFLSTAAPKPDDMPEYDALLTLIERRNATHPHLAFAKLGNVMRFIATSDTPLPDADPFRIRPRAARLLDTWRLLPTRRPHPRADKPC